MNKSLTAIITGGSSGIGEACVELFLNDGYNVAILDIVRPKTEMTSDRLLYQHCDVSNDLQVEEAVHAVHAKFGSIAVLVNNASIQTYGTVTETTPEDWDRVMNVNLKSAFLCARHALPHMIDGGHGVVINVASVQSFLSQRNVAGYTTAKTAILGLTRSIAIDYAPAVRCVAVCPGTIDTPMVRSSMALSPNPDEVMEEAVNMHVLKRIGTPAEVAELIFFLASDKARFITGQAFRIDGGLGITIEASKR